MASCHILDNYQAVVTYGFGITSQKIEKTESYHKISAEVSETACSYLKKL